MSCVIRYPSESISRKIIIDKSKKMRYRKFISNSIGLKPKTIIEVFGHAEWNGVPVETLAPISSCIKE